MVNSSTWTVYHGDSLIPALCFNILFYLTVLSSYSSGRRRYLPSFEQQPLLTFPSVLSNRIPRIRVFFVCVSVMRLATKNDALNTDPFDEVVVCNNCSCSLCSHFFLLKNFRGFYLNSSLQSKTVLKVSWLRWPQIIQRRFG